MLSSIKKERLDTLKEVMRCRREKGETPINIEKKQLKRVVKDLAVLHDLLQAMGCEYELARRDVGKWYDEFSLVLECRWGKNGQR